MVKMFGAVITIIFVHCASVELVIVRVEQGLLRGTILERITGNGKYYSFKGIPYAAPPVGNFRFKVPQPHLPWKGERCAEAHGPICPQIDLNTNEFIPGNEDCLFLNVYTPKLDARRPLAVMFFIHGGNFVSGSGNDDNYKPDFLLDHNVVVVTINYRLGALGFLSLDIEEASGNAGLKDQVAALKWVNRNIANFGGDPNNVTIFGQSAGGTSVSLHVLSPLTKGLFKGAIAMSGVYLNEFSLEFEHKTRALLFTQQLGLYTQDPKEALNFLLKASVQSIVETVPYVLFSEKPRRDLMVFFPFTPIVEKNCSDQHFIIEDPQQLLSEGKTNKVDLIIGHTTQEGTYVAVTEQDYIFKYYPNYKEFLVPSKITNKRNPKIVLRLADRIQKHYFGNKDICQENMKEIITFFSYFEFTYDIHRYLEMWTKYGNKAYFYEFSCFSERNIYGIVGSKYGVNEATHLDDLLYLFDGKNYSLTLNKIRPSYKMIVQTCTLFTNYAKFGNPTPDHSLGTIWLDYSKNKSYLDIGLQLKLKNVDTRPQIDFWRRIFQSVKLIFS